MFPKGCNSRLILIWKGRWHIMAEDVGKMFANSTIDRVDTLGLLHLVLGKHTDIHLVFLDDVGKQ